PNVSISLIFLVDALEPDLKSIGEILNNSKEYSGKEIETFGIASEIKNFSSGDIYFKLNWKNDSIEVRGSFIIPEINQNSSYEVTGILQEYKGYTYIEARKIKRFVP
ncbi:hypothetical protein J4465_02480, partial [Candidatus Pacearchaeota archaeon]|nr:hypothetical protein [Candidatus Pacearchaeota archaeon]